jgi:hypothetical protein
MLGDLDAEQRDQIRTGQCNGSCACSTARPFSAAMCNLYSQTKSREQIRRLFRMDRDTTGNQPPLSGIYPDQLAPVICTARGGCGGICGSEVSR